MNEGISRGRLKKGDRPEPESNKKIKKRDDSSVEPIGILST